LDQEKEEIKRKKGEVVDIITTSENKIIIFGIPENVAYSIEDHIRVFLKHPDGLYYHELQFILIMLT
jgi:hypothetical protein